MDCGDWWWLVLSCLLIIGGIELNPGPRKARHSITNTLSNKKKTQYMQLHRSSDNSTNNSNEQSHTKCEQSDTKCEKQTSNVLHSSVALSNNSLTDSQHVYATSQLHRKRTYSPVNTTHKQAHDREAKKVKRSDPIKTEPMAERESRARKRTHPIHKLQERKTIVDCTIATQSDAIKRAAERKADRESRATQTTDPVKRAQEREKNTEARRIRRSDPVKRAVEQQADRESRAIRRAHPVKKALEQKMERESRPIRRSDPVKREMQQRVDRESRAIRRADPVKRAEERKTNTEGRKIRRSDPVKRAVEQSLQRESRAIRRADPVKRAEERKTNTEGRKIRRSDPVKRAVEQSLQRESRAIRRADPVKRAEERKTNTEGRKIRRSDPVKRAVEQSLQRESTAIRRADPVKRAEERKTNTEGRKIRRSDPVKRAVEQRVERESTAIRRADPVKRAEERKTNTEGRKIRRSDPVKRAVEQEADRESRAIGRADPVKRAEERKTSTEGRTIRRTDPVKRAVEQEIDNRARTLRRSDPVKKLCDDEINSRSKQKLRQNPLVQDCERVKSLQYQRKRRQQSSSEEAAAKRKKTTERKNIKRQNIDIVAAEFSSVIKEGPVYVCSSCHRTLYRHSVQLVPKHRYCNRKKGNYEYVVTNYVSVDGKEWVCSTCHRALMDSRIPTQSVYNDLQLDPIPPELACICQLEARLVSQRLPFMQICSLPGGGQKGIHGPVINVPSTLDTVMLTLPRIPSTSGLVPVKLKRKLMYKGHTLYQCINPSNVTNALNCLLKNNPLYADVTEQCNWIQESFTIDADLSSQIFAPFSESSHHKLSHVNSDDTGQSSDDESSDKGHNSHDSSDAKPVAAEDEESNQDEQLKGLPFNSCLQPTDMQPKKSIEPDSVINIAPGENQHPLSMLQDTSCEVLAFPVEFPLGRFGMNENRPIHVSAKKYFNQRVLNIDPRFARNIDYLFFSQYYTEMKQMLDNISIAMRKGSCGKTADRRLNAASAAGDNVSNLLQQNEGYRFIQNIRGSYPYWERTLTDLNAMVRQLGIPTWFLTLSAADLKWPETIQIIARQHGEILADDDIANMDWQEKCRWIRCNPVTAARHFDFKVQKLLHGVILSPAHPIGHVIDYFFRVEFQQRGSPHIHSLFWVENAPIVGTSPDADVCAFINKYISTQMPSNDEELQQLVSTLQTHSHSTTCRKTRKDCRFHFPRPPTNKTMISHPLTAEDADPPAIQLIKETNAEVLKKVYDRLEGNTYEDLQQLLDDASVPEQLYMYALDKASSTKSVITQRTPSETLINNYNPDLLRIWKANMDIQFVTDPWACARYILEYISKGERQMGKLLKEASKEVVNDDSLRQQMKKVGNVFLSHREVSAQECVYRLLSMPLKRSSRQCVFVNTGMPDTRVRILKPKQVLEKLPDESEDVYQTSMLDRYSARPANLEGTCLADFATLYRTQSGNSDKEESVDEVQNIQNDAGKKITLQRGHGYMKQRKLRCIVRTPRFSRSKQSEAYYHSLLMLYLPWRNELPDLLHGDNLFEEHYQKMKDTVLTNQSLFEHNSKELDDALQNFDCSDQAESAWDKLASEAQHQHNDELDEGRLPSIDHEMLDPTELANRTIAELHASNNANVYVVESQTDRLPNPEYYALLRTLNCEQRSMFDNLLKWCRSSVSSTSIRPQKPDPFHIFVTGGAGTGKSHLIHALVNMMRRELQPICENPEGVTVLLSAPTGTAANNIDGTTIHQAFSIPVRKRGTKDSDYIPMGHDKLATVRFHLQSLKVLIVDEISMVGSNILWYIHRRLQDIMGTPSDDVFFGGVSVIAVGDFYQIPPVLQKPIFATPSDEYARLNPIHMWKDLFKMYELTQIMRQGKDTEFAQLLNRVRVAHVTDSDIQLLKGREVSACQEDYPTNALHVFTDNHKVDQHNQKMLQTIDGPVRHFNAKDWKKDMGTEQAGVSTSSKASETGGLRECLSVGVGARVMLTKNVDVSDGLVNGAIGTVTGFIEPERKCETNFPTAILVQFDSIKAGRKLRMKLKKSPKHPVPIQLDEARFTLGRSSGECVRRQFPLTLCFAATIHKVQGLSLDEIVVCFDGRFNTGQAYVALSRCRTLDGLYLQQFDKKKITVSKPVETEMARLRLNTLDPQSAHLLSTLPHDYFKICHLNIRSLAAHFTDLQSSHPLLTCDIICLSETWLNKSKQTKDYTLDGYSLFRTDREDMHPRCHKHDCKMCNDKGGVAMFIRSDVMCHRQIDVEVKDLECIVVSCKTEPDNVTYIVTLYRPDHIPLNVLNNAVENILSKIPADADVVFTGDFNIDVYKNKCPSALTPLSDGGFVQLISTPTHRLGSLLDHIYVPKIKSGIPSGVIPQYYTDHNAVFCAFPPHVDANNNTSYVLDLNLAKTPQNKHTAHYSKQHVTSNVVSPLTSKSTMKVPQPIFHTKYKETNKKAASTLAATSLVQAVGSHDNSNDVTCTGSEEGNLNPGTFNPPNEQDRLKLSDTYHLPLKNDTNLNPSKRDHSYRSILKELPTQNPRSQIDVMRDDGNCFFRVISKELFGTEDYHAHIRNIICNFMASHPFTFSNWYYLGEVQFYNHVQEMRRSRVWAEEVELLAVASYFHTSIWEYTNSYPVGGPWHWVKIEPLASHPADPPFDGFALHGSFYIHHTNGNHFDRIIAPPSS